VPFASLVAKILDFFESFNYASKHDFFELEKSELFFILPEKVHFSFKDSPGL